MSTFTHFAVLALASASAVLATPPAYGVHKHGHGHKHLHATGASSAYYPYRTANGTYTWGSTGLNQPSPCTSSTLGATTLQTDTQKQTVLVNQNYAQPSSSQSAPGYDNGAAQPSASQSAPGYGNGGAPPAPASLSSSSGTYAPTCDVVTVTNKEKVTVYVTEGQPASSTAPSAPAQSAPAQSSAPVYPVPASSAPAQSSAPVYQVVASSAPAYSSQSSSQASPAKSSAYSAPVYSVPAYSAPIYPVPAPSSSQAAPVSSSSAPVVSQYSSASATASATSSAPATSSSAPSAPSSAGGKRGLAYNDGSLATCFNGASQISWAYNWGSSKGSLQGNYNFIPTLWGTRSDFTGSWSENAKSAISSGSTHLFSFNEPDHPAQANLDPATAAAAYAQYMNPFQGQAKLCAPSVTNGGGAMGLTWLQNFLDACTDCHIDCLNIHWYDSASNTAYFKSHVQDAIKMANGMPVYVSEFGATGSDDEIKSFLEEVMPWMDGNDGVAGYAYYMVSEGLLVSGSEPSTYGSTYMSYTS